MPWNYRIISRTTGGSTSFGVHRVDYDAAGVITSWERTPVVSAATRADLDGAVALVQQASTRPVLQEDSTLKEVTTTPPPPPPPSSAKLVGIYVGNDPGAVTSFEQWFGKPVGGVLGYGNHDSNWTEFQNSITWGVGLWRGIGRRVLWSIPLTVRESTLEQAAAGAYNERYRFAANAIKDFRPTDGVLYVRTGWEFNGNWFPWAAAGKNAAFAEAFRQFVRTFRSVSGRFKFDWCPANKQNNPEPSYPGDEFVDIIGMDFYYDLQWYSSNGATAFERMRTEQYGLQWHKDFSGAHRKPMAYSEWGINNDSAEYMQLVHDWYVSNNVVYQTYWNSDAAFRGAFSHYPNAAARYKTLFSKW